MCKKLEVRSPLPEAESHKVRNRHQLYLKQSFLQALHHLRQPERIQPSVRLLQVPVQKVPFSLQREQVPHKANLFES